jgi:hypothetical protein
MSKKKKAMTYRFDGPFIDYDKFGFTNQCGKSWEQISMVEMYEDMCNGVKLDTIELDFDTVNLLKVTAEAMKMSPYRFLHEVIEKMAEKTIQEHTKEITNGG